MAAQRLCVAMHIPHHAQAGEATARRVAALGVTPALLLPHGRIGGEGTGAPSAWLTIGRG